MDEKTKGAWIIHHKNKLETVSGVQNDFDEIVLAGKCSQLLSAISSTQETVLDHDRVAALAAAVGISKRLELPNVIAELQKQRLINANQHGIAVLGLTSSTVLEYTSKIYNESQPNNYEQAVIELSEKASESPMLYDRTKEYISDTFKLDSPTADDVLDRGKKIGFFDSETTRDQKQLLFNGNLFRNTDVTRISRVLAALNGTETKQMQEVNAILDTSGCVPLEDVVKVTGTDLFNKLQSIGLYDVSSITNEAGECLFVTRPSSFCKFSSSAVDDAFDLAKAFVTSLTFGMVKSDSGRGRIRLIEVLMGKLITGAWVGPATAIGHDYKILEMKGVIQVKPEKGGMYSMRLLKKDVGQLALSVIQEGPAVTGMLSIMPSASVSAYAAPETNRSIVRRRATPPIKKGVSDLLDSLRTGDLQ